MSRPDVAVTGLGAITPAGVGVEETWRRVRAGDSMACRDGELAGLAVDFSCRVPEFTVADRARRRQLWRQDRFTQLALTAADEAVRDAGLDPREWDAPRVGVVLGCGLGGAGTWETEFARMRREGAEAVSSAVIPMLLPNMAAGEVALALAARGPSLSASTACASGASALAIARDWLLAGVCDIVLAGGTEAAITPLVVAGFHQAGALSRRRDEPETASRPFAEDSDGFVMAEAAAVLVLERAEHARARGVRPRALLAGCGASTDALHPTAPHPEGAVAERAVLAALADAGLEARDVDHVNAHATSTPLGDAAEASMIGRVFGHGPSVTSAKGALGHSLGAAGAVEAVLTVLGVERSIVPPTANVDAPAARFDIDLVTKTAREQRIAAAVSNSFGFGGHNVSVVFRAV
ncbi:beta-ketoacyl-[acyl-carrier-protein] synthase family protein [Streptomyces megasporus]|uniref:beta-ketoacyl-[acyl-carrier-protein] synthase family protein n=1 Tax=Streptomyces megasporus TaxID=44060 RepID=UPI0004E13284|nr:beta-ketoacyl-[acyl-carrier-protein] synthase family protein [Streptomyces megasporus]